MTKMIKTCALMLLVGVTACKSQTEVSVNGEKVALNDGLYVNMHTSQGDILIEMYYDAVPMTVGNFIALAEGTHEGTTVKKGEPYFDGILFHRVIPDFMIQAGDPEGTGGGGPGYQFADEIVDTLRHDVPGILSMANAGPGTNGSQFFITEGPTPHLNGRHTVFGKVKHGMSVVNAIARVPRGQNDRPNEDVVIERAEVIRIGQDARNFDAYGAFTSATAEAEAQQELMEADRLKAVEALMADYTEWVTSNGEVDAEKFEAKFKEWESEMEMTPSGLGYIIEEQGEGARITAGDNLQVHYAGYLSDGKFFDSSLREVAQLTGLYDPRREPYSPIPLKAGPDGGVIEGWKEGMMLLNEGGRAKFIIPPGLGYGEQGAGNVIPPNAVLVFDVYVAGVN